MGVLPTKAALTLYPDSFLYIYIESIPSLLALPHPCILALPQNPRDHKQLGQNCKQFFGRGSCILRGGPPSLYERSSKVNKPSRNDLCQAGPTESWRYGSLAQRIILYNRGWIHRETGNLVTADGKVKRCYRVESIPHKASHLTQNFTSRNLFKLKTGLRVWQGLEQQYSSQRCKQPNVHQQVARQAQCCDPHSRRSLSYEGRHSHGATTWMSLENTGNKVDTMKIHVNFSCVIYEIFRRSESRKVGIS